MSYLAMLKKSSDERAMRTLIGYVSGSSTAVADVGDVLLRRVKIRPRNELTNDEWRNLAINYLGRGIMDYGDTLHYGFDGKVIRFPEAIKLINERSFYGDKVVDRYRRMVDQLVPEISAELGEPCELPS